MSALNITFTDDEMTELRHASETEGISMKTLVHDATMEAVRRRKIQAATIRVTAALSEVNKRLAEK